jgi:hypothetical protein
MSEVIRFLEAVATYPPDAARYGDMVSRLGATKEQKRALLDCDAEGLARLLGGRDSMCCMVLGTDPSAH